MKDVQKLFLKKFADSILSFICPELCIHCSKALDQEWKLLCPSCFGDLELLSFLNRCPYCFKEQENGLSKPCEECLRGERFCDYKASCFDYIGPSRSLVKELKYCDQPHLSKSLATFLFLQFTKLKWPLPDMITCVPSSFIRRHVRGYNQSELLAQELAKLIARPFTSLLKKTQSTLSQTLLQKNRRKEMLPTLFQLQQKTSLEDKTILLIDDVQTTGTTLEACARALQEGYPRRIYALSLCYTGI